MAFPDAYNTIVKEENLENGGYVQMEWNDTENTPLEIGTQCPLDSDYILFSKYYPTQQAVGNYSYNVKFLHKLAQLEYLPFYFNTEAVTGVDGSGNVTYEDITLATYPYTGNIETITNALAACLTDHSELGTWHADTAGLSNNVIKSINFDGATIKSAAKSIADAFGVEYFFIWSTKTIKFGTLESQVTTPNYGEIETSDDGVTETNGSLVSATDGGVQYNTFRILGGTKNMSKKTIRGQNVQVTQRLMLDGDSILGGGSPKIMKDLVFDDIYPKMELWMYDVHERRKYLTDENGKKIVDRQEIDQETGGTVNIYKQYSLWYFKLAYWNGTELVPYVFDKNLIIAGQPLSLLFQPNYADDALPQPLVGREFELVFFDALNPAKEVDADDVAGGYQPSHGEFRIIYKVDGSMMLPSTSSESIIPYGGTMSLKNNKVTLVNVAVDSVYEATAKVELLRAATDAIAAYSRDKSSFTYTTYGNAPALGGVAASGGVVKSVRKDLITGEVQYTVGDYQSSKGLIGRMSDKIETASTSAGGAATNDSAVNNSGVSGSSIPLLSMLMGSGSVIKDSLTILKELILGINGHGIFIDGNGDASMTIGSLTVLGTTHLNQIDVNHIRHTGGMMVVTKANLIVDSYEELDAGVWKLYYRRRDGNGQTIHNLFEVGDFALMMTFNEGLSGSVNRYFWRQVIDAGIKTETVVDEETGETSTVDTDLGYITLNYGTYNTSPKEGDVVVQLGNASQTDRQGATVLGGSGTNGGFFAIYEGFSSIGNSAPNLDSYDNALIYLSPRRNKISGDFFNIAGDNLDEQLAALRGEILSIRSQTDKQLVIWYGDDDDPLPNSSDLTHWNTPAKDWHDADVLADNTDQQELHIEDIYYLRRNNTTRVGGRAWQWMYDSTLQKFLWVEITDVDTIAALEAADDAVATANEAKQKVENFGDDGIISAGTEKSELLIQWQDTVAEYLKLIEQAEDYDMDENANAYHSFYSDYESKYNLLAIMLNAFTDTNIASIKSGNEVPAWLSTLNVDTNLVDYVGITGIDGNVKSTLDGVKNEYRARWKAYASARSALLKAIEAAAKAKTDEAHERLDYIADDGVLDPTEKMVVRREFVEMWRERDADGGLIDRCYDNNNQPLNSTIVSSYLNPYKTAFRDIATYLNGSNGTWYTDPTTQQTSDPTYSVINAADRIPLWLHQARKDNTETLTGGTVNGTQLSGGEYWRHLWSVFYAARTALLTALSDDAKERADDAQDTANEKKRVFSTNANELPPVPYDEGDLWMNAVWNSQGASWQNGDPTWAGDQLICIRSKGKTGTPSISDWADAATGTTARIQNLGTQIEAEVRNRKQGTSSSLKLDSTTGGLYVDVYDPNTNTWTTAGLIQLALVKEGSNTYYSKLNLTADNVEMNASLVNVVANTIQAKAALLDFQGGTVKIDASNIGFKVGDTMFDVESGLAKLLINTMVGISGKDAPTGCKNSSWSESPINATSSYPYMWMRTQTFDGENIASTTYIRLKTGSDTGKGVRAQFTASIATTPSGAAIHDSWQSGDIYMRIKGDDDSDWGDWFLVTGERGDETTICYGISQYNSSANANTAPSDISSWSDIPVAPTSSKPYLWKMVQQKTWNSSGQSYTINNTRYLMVTGSNAVELIAQYSAISNPSESDIHNIRQSGDTYMRTRLSNDSNSWSSWHKIGGEKRYSFNISTSATLASGDTSTQVFQQQIGMVIRKETNEAAGEFSFGTYVGGVFKQGLKFETDNGNTKLVLAADTTVVKSDFKVDAQNNIDFNGKTISLNASSTLSISGGTVNLKGTTVQMDADNMQIESGTLTLTGKTIGITGGTINLSATSTLNLTSANLSINADQLTYSGRTIDLTAATISLNADQLTYSGRSIDLTAANLTLNAGQLTYTGQTIDLTAATVSLGADQITFAGKTIALGTSQSKVTINGGDIQVASNKTLSFSSGSIDFTGATVSMSGDNISFSATNSFKSAVGNSGVVLRNDLISAFIEDVETNDGQPLSSRLGLVISKGYASNNFGFGYYTYNSTTQQYDWKGGLNFSVGNDSKTRLVLTADTAKINADALILDGKTVSISASNTFTVSSAGELSLSGGTIEIEGSASVIVKSGSSMTLNSGSSLSISGASLTISASSSITINSGKTLTLSGSGSGSSKGTIDFTGAKISMYAEQIDFKSGNFVVSDGTNDTLKISSGGAVTIYGTVTATAGYIGGTSGWTIESQKIHSGTIGSDSSMFLATTDMTATINGSSRTTLRFTIGSKFGVLKDGSLVASNVDISGAIRATSGSFNGTLSVPADDGSFTYAKNNAFGLYMDSGTAFTSGRADYLYGYTQRGAILRIEQITATSSFRGIYGNCEVEIQGVTQLLRTANKINDDTVFALIVEGIDNKKMTKTVGIKNSGRRVVNVKETSSTSYSVGDSDEKIVFTRSGDQSVTLPSSPEDGREIWLRNKNGGTVSVSASHTMVGDNPSSFTAVEFWHIYTFYNGTWYYGYTQ